jgi:hypothetical protein
LDEKHKKEFMDRSIQDIFHSGLSYSFQKVHSGIEAHVYGDNLWGRSNLEIINEAYTKFRDELIMRREFNDSIQDELNEFFHAIKRLEDYYDNPDTWLTKTDAYIYLEYMYKQHQEFVDLAKEIDEAYKSG